MPVFEQQQAGGTKGYSLRHVGPKSDVWPQPDIAVPTFALLNQPQMIARPLPTAEVPGSPDFAVGAWTGRVNDAGDGTVTFPNGISSDGTPWRDRFDSGGHNQWIEIYNDGYLESVYCVINPNKAMDAITVAGFDGMFMLKKAFERDWVVVLSPRDVIQRATQLWVGTFNDEFPGSNIAGTPGVLNPRWTPTVVNGASIGVEAFGGVTLHTPPGIGATADISSSAVTVVATGTWTVTASFVDVNIGIGGPPLGTSQLNLYVGESSGDQYQVGIGANLDGSINGGFIHPGAASISSQVATATSYDLSLVSDGEWVWGYINGQMIGSARRSNVSTTSLQVDLQALGFTGDLTARCVNLLVESQQPFLMRGFDVGDRVLPGGLSTYPFGGLHARYYNDLDQAGNADRLMRILAPARSQAFSGQGAIPEYTNQQDAQINGQQNPLTSSGGSAGATTSNWSCKWFGAIYLKMSAGDYVFQIGLPNVDCAVRLWIGDLFFGSARVAAEGDAWNFAQSSLFYTYTITPASLVGQLSYGAGAVHRDGWYPIKVEYAVDATARNAPVLYLLNSPAAYTDPGGTAIAAGAGTSPVPATSLSPLGCVDQRYQGQSHFDMAQQTLNAYALEASVEPQRLESGLFPGVLAPRIREGHDTDIVLEPDVDPRKEAILNYSSQEDATDFVSSLTGNGAGFQNGTTGQLQTSVFDGATLNASLFDVQGWQDFSDAAFTELLQALLNSQLGIRLTPWQLVSADPLARSRLSQTWPLPGAVAEMRWRPGDGVRLRARDISLWDITPRQLLTIQRSFTSMGVTATTVGWANRPRGPAFAQRKLFYATSRMQRNYQGQLSTMGASMQDQVTIGPGAFGPSSVLALHPADNFVRAVLRVPYNTNNVPFEIWVNGSSPPSNNKSQILGGPWKTTPAYIDLSPVLTIGSNGVVFVQIKNVDPSVTSVFHYQMLVDVRR